MLTLTILHKYTDSSKAFPRAAHSTAFLRFGDIISDLQVPLLQDPITFCPQSPISRSHMTAGDTSNCVYVPRKSEILDDTICVECFEDISVISEVYSFRRVHTSGSSAS